MFPCLQSAEDNINRMLPTNGGNDDYDSVILFRTSSAGYVERGDVIVKGLD